jgi:galactonate dehydratase
MKITDIKTYPVWIGRRNQLIVKVETDEGIYGWGEAGMPSREMAAIGAVNHYREWLIGRDPLRMGALWQEMYRSQYFEGGRVLAVAISAIDIALYDIAGKALGVPVYQLLGGKQREWVPCFATTKAPMGPELVEDAQLLAERGWPAIRTFFHGAPGYEVGGTFDPQESIGKTAHWLTKVREAIGPGPVLGVDYHHRLTVAEAASFCQRLPAGTLDWLEEPIRAETPGAYASLRRLTPMPLAIGEEFASKWQFLPFLEQGLTNYARLDVCNLGGLTESMKVAALAESHYVDVMPHNPLGAICTAATAHLAAAIPNFAWLEMRLSPTEQGGYYDPDWFPVQPALDEYRLIVPDTPGLGVEFNEERAKRTPITLWEAPHMRRPDGSVTNW